MTNKPLAQSSTLALEAARRVASQASAFDSLARSVSVRALAEFSAIQAAAWPTEQLRKQLEALDPSRGIKEALARTSLLDTRVNALRAAEMSVTEQVRRHMESATKLTSAFAGLDATVLARGKEIEAMLAPSKVASNYLEGLASGQAFRVASEQAIHWLSPYDELAKSLVRFKEPIALASAREFIERIAKASKSTGFSRLLEEASEAQQSPETRQQAKQVLHDVTAKAEAQPTLQEAVDQILLAIEQTKEPLVQKVLLAVAIPFIFLLLGIVLNPVADFYVKKGLEVSSKQGAMKGVKEAARDAVGDVRMLSNYRFVSAKQLPVLSTAKAKAPAIGQLRFSQVVRVIEKDRNFTLVVWRSEDGKAELQGWVFSRYLKRFN